MAGVSGSLKAESQIDAAQAKRHETFRDGRCAFVFDPDAVGDIPYIASADDRDACVARLRRITEDPTQLLLNCVADYVVDQLRLQGNQPNEVPMPGFTNCNS